MSPQAQLHLIQQLSGLTQAALAARIGVSFAAFNRWMRGHAVPRRAAQARIDSLYAEYAGKASSEHVVPAEKLAIISQKRATHPDPLASILDFPDVKDAIYLALTYHSNRIEGNTLSEGDTAAILFRNEIVRRKSLVEQVEAKNHQAALDYLFRHLQEQLPLDETFVRALHGILLNAIRDDAGNYRQHGVRIVGAHVPTANYLKVPERMRELVREIAAHRKGAIAHAAGVHAHFEQIHPFSDGNGRVGRLLMHAMLLRAGIAPAVIIEKRRRSYLQALNRAQMKEESGQLEEVISDAVLEGYRILER